MTDAIVPASPKKSWVQEFVERATGKIEAAPEKTPLSYVRTAGSVAMEVGEGAVIGGLLGVAQKKWGLDSANGPTDGLVALGLGALAIGLSGMAPEFSEYASRGAGQAAAIFAFRKMAGSSMPVATSTSPSPVHVIPASTGSAASSAVAGEDPIEAVARKLA